MLGGPQNKQLIGLVNPGTPIEVYSNQRHLGVSSNRDPLSSFTWVCTAGEQTHAPIVGAVPSIHGISSRCEMEFHQWALLPTSQWPLIPFHVSGMVGSKLLPGLRNSGAKEHFRNPPQCVPLFFLWNPLVSLGFSFGFFWLPNKPLKSWQKEGPVSPQIPLHEWVPSSHPGYA